MTKDKAIKMMKQGSKMTHNYFTADEWMTDFDEDTYVFEDGDKCDKDDFWNNRQSPLWGVGWTMIVEH